MTDGFKRFGFDREFAPDGTVLRDGDTIKRVFTQEEVQLAAEQAAEAARMDEEIQAQQAATQAVQILVGQVNALLGRLHTEAETMRQDAARLALATGRAIAGAALTHYSLDTLEQCITEALADLRSEPRIAVRVTPDLADALAELMEPHVEAMGLEGALIVRADPEVVQGDCILEWRSGAIERTTADIEARIEQAVANWLAHPDEDSALTTPDQATA